MTSQARWTALTSDTVGRSLTGVAVRPCTTVVLPVAGSESHDARPGIFRPPLSTRFEFRCAERGSRARRSPCSAPSRWRRTSSARCGRPTAPRVAHGHLDRYHHRRHRERDQEAEAVVAVAAPPQHPDGVDGRRRGTRRRGTPPPACGRPRSGIAWLKMTASGSTLDDLPGRIEREPGGSFIHEFAATTEMLPPMPGEHDRHAGPEVRPRFQAPPAVDVDGDENRFREEEQPLDGERHAERGAEAPHERRPEQPELEGEDRAGHRPTAKVTATNLDQRCASSRASASLRFNPR